jgi:hypothetical protein
MKGYIVGFVLGIAFSASAAESVMIINDLAGHPTVLATINDYQMQALKSEMDSVSRKYCRPS